MDRLAGTRLRLRDVTAKIPELPRLDWEERSDWLNVKTKFGAVGDGKADDTAAIQAALDSLKPDGFDQPNTVYLPPGTYRITKTLTWKHLYGKRLIGHGRDTRIVWDGAEPKTPQVMFHSDGVTAGVLFEGIVWDGAGKAAEGVYHCSSTHYESAVVHRNELFINMGTGIFSGQGGTFPFKNATAEVLFDNCLFVNVGNGILFLGYNQLDNTVTNCGFHYCTMAIRNITGNVYVRDCHFEGSREIDIYTHVGANSALRCTSVGSKRFLQSDDGFVMQDCHVDGWKSPKGAVIQTGSPFTIFDCTFTNPPSDAPPVMLSSADIPVLLSNCKSEGTQGVLGSSAQYTKAPVKPLVIPSGKRGSAVTSARQTFFRSEVEIPGKVFDARRDFGAKGDGKADDTDAIVATIQAAREHGKKAIAYLPGGQYRVTKTIEVSGENYFIGGAGHCWQTGTLVAWGGPAPAAGREVAVFHVKNARHVTLEGFRVSTPSLYYDDSGVISVLHEASDKPVAGHLQRRGRFHAVPGPGAERPRLHPDHRRHRGRGQLPAGDDPRRAVPPQPPSAIEEIQHDAAGPRQRPVGAQGRFSRTVDLLQRPEPLRHHRAGQPESRDQRLLHRANLADPAHGGESGRHAGPGHHALPQVPRRARGRPGQRPQLLRRPLSHGQSVGRSADRRSRGGEKGDRRHDAGREGEAGAARLLAHGRQSFRHHDGRRQSGVQTGGGSQRHPAQSGTNLAARAERRRETQNLRRPRRPPPPRRIVHGVQGRHAAERNHTMNPQDCEDILWALRNSRVHVQLRSDMNRKWMILIALLLARFAALQAADTPPGQGMGHVIVPHSKEAARNGEASLIELRDGSLLLMYGAHQKSGDWDRGEIRQIRSRDGGKTWSEPETVFSDANRSLFQISFARLANGDLGLTHTSLANGRDAFKVFRRSTDEGKTWSEPLKISDDSHEYTTGPWDKLYVLASGRVIALLHCNLKPDAKKQGGPLGSYTVYSDDNGKTWTRSPLKEVLHVADNPTKKHEWGFWEPSMVETAPGKLLMLGRTTTGWLWESRSEDNGSTWSQPVQSTVPNPVAPAVLTRIPGTETLVLIHNPDVKLNDSWHGGERLALAFRTSHDGGRTWSAATDIYRSPNNRALGGLSGCAVDRRSVAPRLEAHQQSQPRQRIGRHKPLPSRLAARVLRSTPSGRRSPLRPTPSRYASCPSATASRAAPTSRRKTAKPPACRIRCSGGWRKALQDKLRAAGIAFDFVGELNYAAFGRDGVVDPNFDPDHHGLAGFGNTGILKGGVVPTPADVLASLGVKEIKVPGIVDVLKQQQPDVILLMSGANGFDAAARDTLIRTIGDNSTAHLFVATILPQQAPRAGWEKVDAYNASLPAIVAAQQAAGKRITLVDMHAAITTDDLLPDGVHPNQTGMDKMAATWFAALTASPKEAPTPLSPQPTPRQ